MPKRLPRRTRPALTVATAATADKEVLTVAEVMKMTGLGRHLVYASLVSNGGWIPCLAIDNRLVRIPKRAFLAALDKRTLTEPTAKTAKRAR